MMETTNEANPAAAWVRDCIGRFAASGENSIEPGGVSEKAFDEPLVGFSRGDDPLYQGFKDDIGPFYLTPIEIFRLTFPDVKAAPGELTVISWILPQTERTRRDNARESAIPAERWARTRSKGEVFNVNLHNHLVGVLREAGYEAVAPTRSPLWKSQKSDRYGFASSWSERHAAHVSGLGTFGLCDGLITPRGKAMRCGSVVARIAIPPTPRPYDNHHAYCLFYLNGSCGKCIKRCPADAITREGHLKDKCFAYIHDVGIPSVQSRFGFAANACGLCQTGVPCEAGIPVPERS
jgi:epoxyqueuosine reductase